MEVYVAGKRYRLDPSKSKGKGGEADIFELSSGIVAKIWKKPDHQDFTGQPALQRAAQDRIELYQRKLRDLPKQLPAHVVTPLEMCESRSNEILGYTMPFVESADVLLSYSLQSFRSSVGYEPTLKALVDLHEILTLAHKAGVVFGDFNDLNVLVRNGQSFVIDIDSCQFGKYLTTVFTEKFVDPLLCNDQMMLARPHNAASDWYAFAIMVMQSLVFVGPYGGVFRPKNQAHKVAQGHRPLERITVFHPEVMYPKPAVPLDRLPDDLIHTFVGVFTNDKREEFPSRLLQGLRWTNCTVCGTVHARTTCPECRQAAPAAIKAVITVRGTVTSERIFTTGGAIVFACIQQNELRWLSNDGQRFLREDGTSPLHGQMHPRLRYRICGAQTLFGMNGTVVSLPQHQPTNTSLAVESYLGVLPLFDANATTRFWIYQGVLYRDGDAGPKRIGDVLSNQTLFWAGPQFGFGFYRAGNLSQAFVFDVDGSAINDSVQMPPMRGQLIDSTATFSKTHCWFSYAMRDSGKTMNRCCVFDRTGRMLAEAQADDGDNSWLGQIRGKTAVGSMLLCATDDGIVRVEPGTGLSQGTIVQTRTYPDTEPFVSAGDHLFAGAKGVYVVASKEIRLLKIA